jgi:selenide,water dikinase
MATLNRKAAEILTEFKISACTDITGFGLLGHLAEMVCATNIGVTIESAKVPILAEAYDFAAMGLVPVGAHKNREFRKDMVRASATFDPILRDILYDPQTSGGLLVGCPERDAGALVRRLQNEGIVEAAIIGFVTDDLKKTIQLL